jgi:hypothetical protein
MIRLVVCLLAAVALCSSRVLAAEEYDTVDVVGVEISIGTEFIAIGEPVEQRVAFGGSFGAGTVITPFRWSDISLGAALRPSVALGTVEGGFGIMVAHVPLGLTVGYAPEFFDADDLDVGAALAFGMSAQFGPFASDDLRIRPYMSADLRFDIVERGTITIRYMAILGDDTHPEYGRVGFTGISVIGSSLW